MYDRLLRALLAIVGLRLHAQETSAQPAAPPAPVVVDRSIEDLNVLGGAVSNPPFADTILGSDSSYGRSMFEHGTALRANLVPRFTANLLDAPVASSDQRYIGHRPTFI